MKELVLMRHADAEKSSFDDMQRQITDLGVEQIKKISSDFSGNVFSKIIVSPSVRTQQSYELLSFYANWQNTIRDTIIEINYKIYCSTYLDIINLISEQDNDVNSVLIIGHNPSISQLCNYLSGDNFSFKTASYARLKFNEELDWKDACLKRNFLSIEFYGHDS